MQRRRIWMAIASVGLMASCGGVSSDDTATVASSTGPASTVPDATTTDPPTADATTIGSSATVPPTTAPDAAAFPRTVEHALGETEVPAAPARVVALDRSVIDAALSLDLELVGYTTYSDPDGALPEYFGAAIADHASEAVWVGDLMSPNLEAIAELQPDLILTSAVRHENIYDQLSAIAPTIATDSAGGGWKDGFRLVAAASGTEVLADEQLAAYEQRAADVGTAINETADSPTISVVRFVDAIRLYQPVSFSGVVLEDAGLARPESQQDRGDFIRIISEEELALADADVILYTVYENEAVQDLVEGIQSRPLWGTLGAVQNDQAYPILDDTWMSGVGLVGAHRVLDDLEQIFGVAS